MTAFLDLIDLDEDKEKFRRLYDHYVNLLLWLAGQKVEDPTAAEDCVQETFLYVAKNFDKIGDIASNRTKGYLCTIVTGFAIKYYNKVHRFDMHSMEDENRACPPVKEPANAFEFMDSVALSIAIDRLSDEERMLVYLKYVYEMPVKEIAKLYKLNDYYLNKKINSALDHIREFMMEE